MRRILLSALLVILSSAPLLNAEDKSPAPNAAVASLADLSRRGQIPQVIQTADSLLATDTLSPPDRAIVLVYLGNAYQERGEFTQATASYEKSLAISERDSQHQSDYAGTLSLLATVYAQTGQFDTAKHLMLRSIHLFENGGDHAQAAIIWSDLATIAANQHSRGEAHKDMAHCVAESQLANNLSPAQLAAFTTTQGRIAELDGDSHTAIQDYQHAIDLRNQGHQDQDAAAWLYILLGGAYLQAGDLANARETTSRGLSQLEANSGRETVRYHLAELTYSKVLDASGSHDEASTLRKEAQSALNSDRQRAQSTISVSALR